MLDRIDRFWPHVLAAAVGLFIVLGLIAPGSEIIDLELAGTSENAADAMAGWDIGSARVQTAVDYVFLTILGFGVVGALRWSLGASTPLVWLAPIAAVCDAIENAGIFVLLSAPSDPSGAVAAVTTTFAAVKFLALTGALVAFVVGVVRRRRAAPA